MSGWVCSYRAIWDHPLFAGDAERVGVWDWMVKKAAWKVHRFRVGGEVIRLERGELCVSQGQICTETGMTRKRLRAFLDDLQRENAVVIKSANGRAKGRSLITIQNYDKYQDVQNDEGQAKGQRRAKEGPSKEQGNKDNHTSPIGEDAGGVVSFSISKVLFDVVVPALIAAGTDAKQARTVVGMWRKAGNTDVDILNAFEAAQKAGAAQPLTYMQAILTKPTTDMDEVAALLNKRRAERGSK